MVETTVPGGCLAQDWLHPEWANLRFHQGACPEASSISGSAVSGSTFAATGPSAHAVRFRIGTTRMWGIGLLPLGWARYVGVPAQSMADAVVDGHAHPAFTAFAPLAATLFRDEPDEDAELARIAAYFQTFPPRPVPDEARIQAIHAALVDPELDGIAGLVRRTGVSQRTLERLCARHFGFSPKLLLRRQRFMRSLSQYVLDPSLRWIGAIDGQYHDQAQFVRDFHQFMGMTPSHYASIDKPILSAIMHERARFAGAAVQALDGPGGGAG
ncbi:MAG: AraC family transcriptional regulator [Sphingomonadales bacterium]|nr:AraC family transcriptional regulator [Sphingomonadales bacterium]